MKQNPGFVLKEIVDIPYLLPFGQMIADHRRGLKTNTTGVYLWNLLTKDLSLEEVLSRSATYYNVSSDELPAFREDITQFVNSLLSLGILMETAENSATSTDTITKIQISRNTSVSSKLCNSEIPAPDDRPKQTEYILSIGGLNLKLTIPDSAFPSDFTAFVVIEPNKNTLPIHQTIILHSELPAQEIQGQTLLNNSELNIIEQAEQYILHFPAAKKHLEIHLNKDGHTAHCYCLPPYTDQFHYDFFHAIRLIYLYLAQKSGMVALHSASILYKGKLWLFSGHSGMGKSTHTNLWKESFHTPVINGDLNLLAWENNFPVIHGIPWCGTSKIYNTQTYPLGGIILLNQSPENKIEELTPDQKQLLVSQRLISPSWTKNLLEKNFELVANITKNILVCKLHCTKEAEAAKMMKQYIDTTAVTDKNE